MGVNSSSDADFGNLPPVGGCSQLQLPSSTISLLVSVMTRPSCVGAFFVLVVVIVANNETVVIINDAQTTKLAVSALPGFAFMICTTWSNRTGPASTFVNAAIIEVRQTAAITILRLIFSFSVP